MLSFIHSTPFFVVCSTHECNFKVYWFDLLISCMDYNMWALPVTAYSIPEFPILFCKSLDIFRGICEMYNFFYT